MPTLSTYLQQVRLLLNDTSGALYTDPDLTNYINDARVQVAGDTESIRQPATLQTVVGQRAYAWNGATFIAAPTTPQGIGGILSIKMMSRNVDPGGSIPMTTRGWPWFNYYYVQLPIPNVGAPIVWATFQPGENGTFWIDPIPDSTYTLNLDPICFPIALVDDSTFDAVQYPWSDAVQYYASYLAYLNSQRQSDADRMFQSYNVFARRGTQLTTPSLLAEQYAGAMGTRNAATHTTITTTTQTTRQG